MSVVRSKKLLAQVRQLQARLDTLESEIADWAAATQARRHLRASESVVPYATAKRYARERNAVRAERVLRGMTQAELAAKLDVSQSYVAAVESGRKRLGVKQAKRLASIFRCDFRTLLE